MTRLFVGNLSRDTSEDSLRAKFEECGTVTGVSILFDPVTGQSRGFGFVEYESDDGADRAIAELNGVMLDGRNLRVDKARPRQEGRGGGGGGGGRDRRGGPRHGGGGGGGGYGGNGGGSRRGRF